MVHNIEKEDGNFNKKKKIGDLGLPILFDERKVNVGNNTLYEMRKSENTLLSSGRCRFVKRTEPIVLAFYTSSIQNIPE